MSKKKQPSKSSGTIYVVATPIGNLSDVSPRAIETLRSVDLIACEDTRVTRKLLSALDIKAQTTSLHQHSSCAKEESLVKEVAGGLNLAIVTDAGTPAISDPGAHFLSLAVEAGITIAPIPGPSALTAALSVCGFPTSTFTFVGFPPHKKGRATFFKQIAKRRETVVLYESKHRIIKTLEELPQSRQVMVGRELTKLHETIYRGTTAEVTEALKEDSTKGEFVIVLGPSTNKLL